MKSNEILQENQISDPLLQQALASLRLENMQLSKEALQDVALLASGKMTAQEVLDRELARVHS
jgi:hypothetical protein